MSVSTQYSTRIYVAPCIQRSPSHFPKVTLIYRLTIYIDTVIFPKRPWRAGGMRQFRLCVMW